MPVAPRAYVWDGRLPMRCRVTVCLAALLATALPASLSGAQSPRPEVTIDAPSAGLVTSARTVTVAGRAPAQQRGQLLAVRVKVNGRPVLAKASRSGYKTVVALTPGENTLTATAEATDADIADDPKTIAESQPVRVIRQRTPGDNTGTLDRATAYLVTEYSDAAYWQCGESDDCHTDPACFALSTSRVDCPVATRDRARHKTKCGFVMTVRLRGTRLFYSSYGCRSRRWKRPRRHVREELYRRGRQFRLGSPIGQEDAGAPNRYGAPRFDVARDVFLP
jgi:hypothetical protein